MADRKTALLMTVGTGTAGEFEATMRTPFSASFRTGEWTRIVLLASHRSLENARQLQRCESARPIEVKSLRKDKDEEDADRCFEFFETVIERLIEEDFEPENMTADFTRGTKAMSAGLALAGIRYGLRSLRYIGATERSKAGLALPGCEVVSDFAPRAILESRQVEQAVEFLRAGQFGAVRAIYPGYPLVQQGGKWKTAVRWLQWASEFWAAWDALDYAAARRLAGAPNAGSKPPRWAAPFIPDTPRVEMLDRLSRTTQGQMSGSKCRDLAADVLRNAARRLRAGLNEDALIRIYRVTELIGQARLFDQGLDSGSVPPGEPRLLGWQASAQYREAGTVAGGGDEVVKLGREQVAGFLCYLNDPLGPSLLALAREGDLQPKARNTSILIHGFRARGGFGKDSCRATLRTVREFFVGEDPGNAQRLAACGFPFEPPEG